MLELAPVFADNVEEKAVWDAVWKEMVDEKLVNKGFASGISTKRSSL